MVRYTPNSATAKFNSDTNELEASVKVANTGGLDGDEIVQVFYLF